MEHRRSHPCNLCAKKSARFIYKLYEFYTVAPLAWVPWIPGNPSILEQCVPELINFGKKGLKFAQLSAQNKQEMRVQLLKNLGTYQYEFLTEPLHVKIIIVYLSH